MKKLKMDKATYQEYLDQKIFFDMKTPKWGKNRSALIFGKGLDTRGRSMPVEVEVTGFYVLAKY
tara:strand:- start:235 stop:426 length:192 start_codon:yes stop_codon:yes gene_type:complete